MSLAAAASELEPEETPGASQALQHGSTISRHEPSPQDSAHVLHRSFSLLNEAILFRVSRLNEAIPFRALPHRRRLLARASPLLNASAAIADCFSPQETASLLCAPTWPTVPARNPLHFPIPIYYTTRTICVRGAAITVIATVKPRHLAKHSVLSAGPTALMLFVAALRDHLRVGGDERKCGHLPTTREHRASQRQLS